MPGKLPAMGLERPALQQPYHFSPYQQHLTFPPPMGYIPAPYPRQYIPSSHPATVIHRGTTAIHVPPPMHLASNVFAVTTQPAHYPVQSAFPTMQAHASYMPPPQQMYQVRHTQPLGPQIARPPVTMDHSVASLPGMIRMAGMQPQESMKRFVYPGQGVTTGLPSVTATPNPSLSAVSSAICPPSVPPNTIPTSNVSGN